MTDKKISMDIVMFFLLCFVFENNSRINMNCQVHQLVRLYHNEDLVSTSILREDSGGY